MTPPESGPSPRPRESGSASGDDTSKGGKPKPKASPRKSRASSKPEQTYTGRLALNTIHKMDAIEGLKQIPDASIDLVVTDPPYNIASPKKLTMHKGQVVSTASQWGLWDTFHPFDFDLFIMQVISQCYRVLKPGGAMYLFTSREDNGYFIRKAVQRGFTYRSQLAMVRRNPLPSFYKNCYRSGYETCMYLTKGRTKTFNFLSQAEANNVLTFTSGFKASKHPTEKPLAVIKRFIQFSSNPGDIVLDPFMGSGTTAVAAKELGRQFLGFELNPDYLKMADARLAPATESKVGKPGKREHKAESAETAKSKHGGGS